jgi:geranylgeranyl diphosphate synthase type II
VSVDVASLLDRHARDVVVHLERVVPAANADPATIHAAMRHSLFAGGKRLRPALVLASAEAAGCRDAKRALPVAAALEMIHTYSLIHDDLPCMDDDDLRRGRPTCHVVFGEAIAVLAGDALLTLAFTHLGDAAEEGTIPAAVLPRLLKTLGHASGTPAGMIAGQVADIEAEGKDVIAETLASIHRRKTGALIEAACVCGALVAEPDAKTLDALGAYGRALGLTFQIVDDILDVTASSDGMGKTVGKDAAQGKATYPGVHGLDAARQEAKRQATAAREALKPLGDRGRELVALVEFVLSRSH